MRTGLGWLLIVVFGGLLVACDRSPSSRSPSSASGGFTYTLTSKAAMLDALFKMDEWLLLNRFEPCATPPNSGFVQPTSGSAFCYRGTYHGSAPFYLRLTLDSAQRLHLGVEYYVAAVEDDDGAQLKKLLHQAQEFTQLFQSFVASLPK